MKVNSEYIEFKYTKDEFIYCIQIIKSSGTNLPFFLMFFPK